MDSDKLASSSCSCSSHILKYTHYHVDDNKQTKTKSRPNDILAG